MSPQGCGREEQGNNQVKACQGHWEVGCCSSSDETCEVEVGRVGGAKGSTEQGTRGRER